MDKKDIKLDNSLLLKLLGKSPKRKITDSTFTKYLKRSKPSTSSKPQKSGLGQYDTYNKPISPLFTDSIKVQKIKLITHREAVFLNHSKRDLACLTERYCSVKSCNLSANSFRANLTTGTQKTIPPKPSPQILKLKYLNIPKISKNMQKITVKEASKDGDWSSKARPEIEKLWRYVINRSNGVEGANVGNFKVYIGKGNNSRLIKKIFASRPWWSLTESVKEADFVWTQWKSEEIISGLPKGVELMVSKKSTLPGTNYCPINIKGDDNMFKMVTIDELNYHLIRNSSSYTYVEINSKQGLRRIYNKIEFNEYLTDKKGLFYTMSEYYASLNEDPFEFMPVTFHIESEKSANFLEFCKVFQRLEEQKQLMKTQNLWIVKPAEKSNRGQGISICGSISQIQAIVGCRESNHSYILQKYIEKPFLIHKRKFDFRCFALVTSVNSVIQGYFYTEGYLRTASAEFSTKDITDNFKHLTNDAIQKFGENYGRFEDGNKMSYREFQRYLDNHYHEKKVNFFKEILPEIKKLIKDTFLASFSKIDTCKRLNCMEILGYDFMLDCNLKPWLIEVNTNPCLETSCSILSILIPAMVENSVKIAVDPIFTPNGVRINDGFSENKYELIFHELTDGEAYRKMIQENKSLKE